jgi:hypothetical protein
VRQMLCAECGALSNPVWRFASSSRGPVVLCAACRVTILERSRPAGAG